MAKTKLFILGIIPVAINEHVKQFLENFTKPQTYVVIKEQFNILNQCTVWHSMIIKYIFAFLNVISQLLDAWWQFLFSFFYPSHLQCPVLRIILFCKIVFLKLKMTCKPIRTCSNPSTENKSSSLFKIEILKNGFGCVRDSTDCSPGCLESKALPRSKCFEQRQYMNTLSKPRRLISCRKIKDNSLAASGLSLFCTGTMLNHSSKK